MRAKVLAFPINGSIRAGWNSQELAEIYRLEHLLGQRGLLSEIGSGVTDEGDPWLVVYDPSGTDITANITRVAGRYLVVRVDSPDPVYAASLREFANAIVHGTPLAGDATPLPKPDMDGEDEAAAAWIFVIDEHHDGPAMPVPEHASDLDGSVMGPTDDRLEEVGRLLLALIAGVAEMQQDAAGAAQEFEAALALADPIDDQSPPDQTQGTDLSLTLPAPVASDPPPSNAGAAAAIAMDLAAIDDAPHSHPDPARAGLGVVDGLSGPEAEESQPATVTLPHDDAVSVANPEVTGPAPAAAEGPGEASRISNPTNQDDKIIGTSGNDFIDAGFGNDTVIAGAGNDTVDAGQGNDSVDGGSGDDVINGGEGDDTLLGGDGNDQIRGGTGSNVIDTGSGNNLVISESGHDAVSLGDGHDVVVVMPRGSGNTTVTDFDENTDTLVVLGLDEGSHTTVDPNHPGTQVISVTPDTTITITGTTPLLDPLA